MDLREYQRDILNFESRSGIRADGLRRNFNLRLAGGEEDQGQDNLCAICYTDMDDPGDRYKFPCAGNHFFHAACICQWIDMKGSRANCPSCRAPFNSETDPESYRIMKTTCDNRVIDVTDRRWPSWSRNFYTGQWRGGPHGRGKLKYEDGKTYDGEWQNGLKHGQGVMHWPHGDKYDGEFRNGRKWGRGTYTWRNGKTYVGQWYNDKMNDTQGEKRWPDGKKYIGNFVMEVRTGDGLMQYTDNLEYRGLFRNGKRHGRGIFTWKKYNVSWTGQWTDGHPRGSGVYRYIGGTGHGVAFRHSYDIDESPLPTPFDCADDSCKPPARVVARMRGDSIRVAFYKDYESDDLTFTGTVDEAMDWIRVQPLRLDMEISDERLSEHVKSVKLDKEESKKLILDQGRRASLMKLAIEAKRAGLRLAISAYSVHYE